VEHELAVGIHQLGHVTLERLRFFASNDASLALQQRYLAETANIHL